MTMEPKKIYRVDLIVNNEPVSSILYYDNSNVIPPPVDTYVEVEFPTMEPDKHVFRIKRVY